MTEEQNHPKDEFDALINGLATELGGDALIEALATVDALRARVNAYEESARTARHALRKLRKTGDPAEAGACLDAIRTSLRAIHPSEPIAPEQKGGDQ